MKRADRYPREQIAKLKLAGARLNREKSEAIAKMAKQRGAQRPRHERSKHVATVARLDGAMGVVKARIEVLIAPFLPAIEEAKEAEKRLCAVQESKNKIIRALEAISEEQAETIGRLQAELAELADVNAIAEALERTERKLTGARLEIAKLKVDLDLRPVRSNRFRASP